MSASKNTQLSCWREIQIEPQTRYLKLKWKTLETPNVGKDFEQWELSHGMEKSVKRGKHFGKKV